MIEAEEKQELETQAEQKIQNELQKHKQPKTKQKIEEPIESVEYTQKIPETPKRLYKAEPEKITQFDPSAKSPSIQFSDLNNRSPFQNGPYYQNSKLILSVPLTSMDSTCQFRVQNVKYCVGVGIALKQVIIDHNYTYQSQGSTQLSHGLYIVTSQGFSWSHSQKNEDDVSRNGFKDMYNGMPISVQLKGQTLSFRSRKNNFTMLLPNQIRQKYTLCFCAYLHEKQDAVQMVV